MKNLIALIIVAIIVVPHALMAQDHSHENMNHNNSMSNNEMEAKHVEVSNDFKTQLNGVYKASLGLNKAFTEDNGVEAQVQAGKMLSAMQKVNMGLITGDAHMAWMAYMKDINNGLKAISASADLEVQRKMYASVNEGLYKAVKSFGVGETVYYQYCPMAKASWLNDGEEINNPYYGGKMLKCGSTKEVLN